MNRSVSSLRVARLDYLLRLELEFVATTQLFLYRVLIIAIIALIAGSIVGTIGLIAGVGWLFQPSLFLICGSLFGMHFARMKRDCENQALESRLESIVREAGYE